MSPDIPIKSANARTQARSAQTPTKSWIWYWWIDSGAFSFQSSGSKFWYELENDIRLEQLQQILDHNKNTKEYFCSFKGDVEVGWITILDDNHPLVVQYFKQINEPLPLYSVYSIPPPKGLSFWDPKFKGTDSPYFPCTGNMLYILTSLTEAICPYPYVSTSCPFVTSLH